MVRTEAAQCCYSDTGRALGTNLAAAGPGAFAQATVLGHGGIGIVEAVGSMVKRVQVGDRVIVSNTAQCGECYNCLRGRADHCLLNGAPALPVAQMRDGTPVVQWNNEGGYSELMVPYENRCVPIFSSVPSREIAILHCVGGCGLGATMTLAPIEPASDVVVFGAGPLGLSAIQGARIKGAAQIIAVEPIRYRRDVALKVGATIALDPNAEGDGLVDKIRNLCKGTTDRAFAGGANAGPDWVMEAVGGDQFTPKAEAGPDPTGVLPLHQAWDVCSPIGNIDHRGDQSARATSRCRRRNGRTPRSRIIRGIWPAVTPSATCPGMCGSSKWACSTPNRWSRRSSHWTACETRFRRPPIAPRSRPSSS